MSKVFGQALLDDMVRSQSLPMPLVKDAAKEILAVIREGLIQDGVVKVSNFGTFRLKPVSARQGINPRTGEAITIPAQQRVIFSPCKALRDLIQPVYRPPIPLDPEQSSPERTLSGAAVTSMTPRHTGKITNEPPASATKKTSEEQTSIPLAPSHSIHPTVPTVVDTPQEATEKPRPEVVQSPTRLSLSDNENAQKPEPTLGRCCEEDEVIELRVVTIESQQQEKEETSEIHVKPFDSRQHNKKEEVNEVHLEPIVAPLHNGRITEFPMRPENHSHAESETFPQDGNPITGDTRASSHRYYIAGAATVLLIALISAGLLIESETDINNTPPATVAIESPSPAMALSRSEPVPEIVANDRDTTGDTQPLIAATPVIESDSSLAKTEIDDQLPTGQTVALDTMTGNNDKKIAGLPVKESSKVTESGSPVVTQISNYYFTEQVHDVSNGESLWRLARHHYQDPLLWPHIYQANISTIANPDHLLVGGTIAIPTLQGPPDQLSKADRRHIAEGYYLAYQHYKKIGRPDALFALLEAKRYDSQVVEEHRSLMQLSGIDEIQLAQQQTMPF